MGQMATCKDCIHEKVCDSLIKSGCPYLDEEIPANAFCMEFKNKADVVEVVRCKDCVLHTHCFIEDHYNFVGIENPFCCVGKSKSSKCQKSEEKKWGGVEDAERLSAKKEKSIHNANKCI